MKIWIDMTAPAHVLVFRPIIPRLREQGHEVEVTARDYAQTLQLLELHGIEATAFGRHGGAPRARQLPPLPPPRRPAPPPPPPPPRAVSPAGGTFRPPGATARTTSRSGAGRSASRS